MHSHNSFVKSILLILLCSLSIACQPSESADANSSDSSASAIKTDVNNNRIVVIGDLHADIGVTRKAFQLAGAINEEGEWIGQALTVVQLGDFIGRSDDDRQVLDFMFDIREKAEQGGGKVHNLIGNHEVFGGRVDNQAVGRSPFSAFEDMEGLDLEDPRLQRLPPEQRARGAALMSGGPYARRIAEFPAVLKLGKTIYVHAGVLPRWAEYGIDRINQEVSQWLMGDRREPNSTRGVDNGDGVMWTRQLTYNVDFYDCELLEESLNILGAERMIVAHTVHREITSRCNDKLWAIDVGMSRAYGGDIQLLEIIDDEQLKVLRP
ncbi:MAG: calcineurin [Gammaproteobacteria bacterium]|jgi:hypothetical protein|nr:calcineurin [Gammaproteobacteria bacterium]MBT3860183.1 calcineurin [Gammaproteobacteria bacterium]MBT3987475.1 calcineurin [Gammaproteobacteria bacterium]MBT4255586.1 calcineurin [Gammaproteobacteria bacterium]MBT4581787.1 calcineurin [Gammaproteobacteria bacterium]